MQAHILMAYLTCTCPPAWVPNQLNWFVRINWNCLPRNALKHTFFEWNRFSSRTPFDSDRFNKFVGNWNGRNNFYLCCLPCRSVASNPLEAMSVSSAHHEKRLPPIKGRQTNDYLILLPYFDFWLTVAVANTDMHTNNSSCEMVCSQTTRVKICHFFFFDRTNTVTVHLVRIGGILFVWLDMFRSVTATERIFQLRFAFIDDKFAMFETENGTKMEGKFGKMACALIESSGEYVSIMDAYSNAVIALYGDE